MTNSTNKATETNEIRVGDRVETYDYTHCRVTIRTVVAVDVPVLWVRGKPLGVRVERVGTRLYHDVRKV